MPAIIGCDGAVGYRIAVGGEAGADPTDPEWRALTYAASDHAFSGPRLGLEGGEGDLVVGRPTPKGYAAPRAGPSKPAPRNG
jgi:hypothetical protein